MVFFINRVAYLDSELHKDCRPFSFEPSILVGKAFQSERTMAVKSKAVVQEKEITEEKEQLKKWLIKADSSRENIQNTISYLKARDAPLLSEPIVVGL